MPKVWVTTQQGAAPLADLLELRRRQRGGGHPRTCRGPSSSPASPRRS
ncbi:MAG: hypothetical protein MZU95_13920 [Desulfomicrobium escambiense]|nr:hypothetical protein [Desulfomicrobium escambiense]